MAKLISMFCSEWSSFNDSNLSTGMIYLFIFFSKKKSGYQRIPVCAKSSHLHVKHIYICIMYNNLLLARRSVRLIRLQQRSLSAGKNFGLAKTLHQQECYGCPPHTYGHVWGRQLGWHPYLSLHPSWAGQKLVPPWAHNPILCLPRLQAGQPWGNPDPVPGQATWGRYGRFCWLAQLIPAVRKLPAPLLRKRQCVAPRGQLQTPAGVWCPWMPKLGSNWPRHGQCFGAFRRYSSLAMLGKPRVSHCLVGYSLLRHWRAPGISQPRDPLAANPRRRLVGWSASLAGGGVPAAGPWWSGWWPPDCDRSLAEWWRPPWHRSACPNWQLLRAIPAVPTWLLG